MENRFYWTFLAQNRNTVRAFAWRERKDATRHMARLSHQVSSHTVYLGVSKRKGTVAEVRRALGGPTGWKRIIILDPLGILRPQRRGSR